MTDDYYTRSATALEDIAADVIRVRCDLDSVRVALEREVAPVRYDAHGAAHQHVPFWAQLRFESIARADDQLQHLANALNDAAETVRSMGYDT